MTRISKNTLRIAAALLCVALIVLGGLIGRTRAALLEGSEADLQMGMSALDVQLVENAAGGETVFDGDEEGRLFADLAETKIDPGYTYPETVAARNSGSSDEYVRIIVKKYWTDADGKDTEVSPDAIELVLNDKDWFEDKSESSTEKSVYYCRRSVAAGSDSPALFTGIRISPEVMADVSFSEPDDDKVVTATFRYNGLKFNIEAEVQAIQYEHAGDAAGSAWGVTDISFSGGVVSPK